MHLALKLLWTWLSSGALTGVLTCACPISTMYKHSKTACLIALPSLSSRTLTRPLSEPRSDLWHLHNDQCPYQCADWEGLTHACANKCALPNSQPQNGSCLPKTKAAPLQCASNALPDRRSQSPSQQAGVFHAPGESVIMPYQWTVRLW